MKLFIVQAKLDGPSLEELFSLAEQHCERLCADVEDADVVITAITMRRRLERTVSWDIAVSLCVSSLKRTKPSLFQKSKAVVTPSWLRDSVAEGKQQPCEYYVALQDLRDETVKNCPSCNAESCACEDTDLEEPTRTPYSSPPTSRGSRTQQPPPRKRAESVAEGSKSLIRVPENLLPPDPSLETNLSRLDYNSRYACQRASPLVCPNQSLAVELDIIKRSRALEGEDRSALSYSRAIATIKGMCHPSLSGRCCSDYSVAYPRVITSRRQIEKLPYLGPKILALVNTSSRIACT